MAKHDGRTIADLPFDSVTMDVVCRRVPTGELDTASDPMTRVSCNITQAVISHSPTGFEWGYSGSGPSDFALNILHLFLPPHTHTADCYEREEGQPFLVCYENVKCYFGEVSRAAWNLHHWFKEAFVARLPHDGGTIKGADVRAWIEANRDKGDA